MQYRMLGRTGLKVSAISLGTEYLIDLPVEHVRGVIHRALDMGVNYFDLFWPQPWFRDVMGRAFEGRRDDALLAAHLGAVMRGNQAGVGREPEEAESFLRDFLARYHTDHVDLLYLHNCDKQSDYDRLMSMDGLLGLALRLREQGVARYLAFSGHTVSTALQAAESGFVDVIMFPVNLVGHAVPGKREFLQRCAALDVGIVAMKPYAGGKLLQPEQVMSMDGFHVGGDPMELRRAASITPAQCLSYVLSQPGVSTVVPGCRSIDELEQAQAYWAASDGERGFGDPLAAFGQSISGECVYCNHCLPCPSEINIGTVMRLLDAARLGRTAELQAAYDGLSANADDCVACGACEERCPFDVTAVERMQQAAELFAT